jgi:hypothetical protein
MFFDLAIRGFTANNLEPQKGQVGPKKEITDRHKAPSNNILRQMKGQKNSLSLVISTYYVKIISKISVASSGKNWSVVKNGLECCRLG